MQASGFNQVSQFNNGAQINTPPLPSVSPDVLTTIFNDVNTSTSPNIPGSSSKKYDNYFNRVLQGANVEGEFHHIVEDSKFRKFLACIPLVGVVFSLINQHTLMEKIKISKNPLRVIKLIDVKNDFKYASMVRGVISTACITAAVGVALFNPLGAAVAVTVGLAGVSALVINAYKIKKNKQLIQELTGKLLRCDHGDLSKIARRVS